jgi:hypothetical protein
MKLQSSVSGAERGLPAVRVRVAAGPTSGHGFNRAVQDASGAASAAEGSYGIGSIRIGLSAPLSLISNRYLQRLETRVTAFLSCISTFLIDSKSGGPARLFPSPKNQLSFRAEWPAFSFRSAPFGPPATQRGICCCPGRLRPGTVATQPIEPESRPTNHESRVTSHESRGTQCP